MNEQKPYRRVLGNNPTSSQIVDYLVGTPGVIASAIYIHNDLGCARSRVVSCLSTTMDQNMAYSIVRDLRSMMISAKAKTFDLVIDNSIRVVTRIIDPCQLCAIGVFVMLGSPANKSLQRTIAKVVQVCNPGGS